jgi:murein DD-endopeptidase MepM/ murein hydrolase activator NlpD
MTRVVVVALLIATGCAVQGPHPGADRQAEAPGASSRARQGASTARVSYRFPVRGRTSYGRAHHDYPATDIFAACRTPVVAPAGGVLLEVSRRDRYRPGPDSPALRGGRFWSLRGDDRVRYYGSHLRSLAPGVRAGRRVHTGTLLGRVGQSGNARGTGCHLHFGISPVCAGTGDWWVRRGVVRPFRFLRAWERGRDRSPARAVRRWRAEHGCPRRPG